MTLSLDENHANYQIRAYQKGKIKINEDFFTKSLIVSPTTLILDWRPQNMADLKKEDLQIIIPLSPAILLIGTGSELIFPDLEIYGDLINEGIGVEVMDTAAASRTYTALTAEDRNVVAALMLN